jgi:Mrp family chromosome partitioning ATPase
LRRNALGKLFPTTPDRGLVEVLATEAAFSDVVTKDVVAGVDVVPLAAANYSPTDMFGDGRMGELLRRLRQDYDHIILDAPPVLAVTDARQLVALSDTTLLIVRWGKTPRQAVSAAVDRLEADGASIAGVVLTLVNVKAKAFLGSNDAHYYHKSYKHYYIDT